MRANTVVQQGMQIDVEYKKSKFFLTPDVGVAVFLAGAALTGFWGLSCLFSCLLRVF